jgi:Holliday junction resolvase RusA-like endonuclease
VSNLVKLYEATFSPKMGEVVFRMTVQEKAVSKERPRFAKGHAYTSKRTRDFENMIESNARLVMTNDIADYPLKLQMHLVFEIPKSWPKWKRELAILHRLFPSKGDVDNKVKAVTDALNGVAYIDDRQIVQQDVMSYYGATANIITLTLYRAGWSMYEAERFADWSKKNAEHNEGSPEMG